MVKDIASTNRALNIKEDYLHGEHRISDEEEAKVDIYALINKVFGQGVELNISVTAKNDADIDL